MERLYQIIAKHFTASEIEILAGNLSVFVPPNSEPTAMARELFLGARRNLRLDVLFNDVYRNKAGLGLDLGENLYELIAGTFNEKEVAELTVKMGFDQLGIGLDSSGLIGWNNDNFYKRQKAKLIQTTAVDRGEFSLLLETLQGIRSSLDLTAFKLSALAQDAPQSEKKSDPSTTPQTATAPDKEDSPRIVYNIYGDHITGDKVGGDQVGGDKVGGDKAGDDIIKGVTVSGNSGRAISSGGNASVTYVNQVQNQGDLLNLISQINQELAAIKAELDARDAEEAAEILEDIEQEIQAEEPNANRIARKLRNISEIAEMVTTGAQVTANIGLAIQGVQALFGG